MDDASSMGKVKVKSENSISDLTTTSRVNHHCASTASASVGFIAPLMSCRSRGFATKRQPLRDNRGAGEISHNHKPQKKFLREHENKVFLRGRMENKALQVMGSNTHQSSKFGGRRNFLKLV